MRHELQIAGLVAAIIILAIGQGRISNRIDRIESRRDRVEWEQRTSGGTAYERAMDQFKAWCPAVDFGGLAPGRYLTYIDPPESDTSHVWYLATLVVEQSGDARLESGINENDLPDSIRRLRTDPATK